MSTPLNKELQELRNSIEHYESVLRMDKSIKSGEIESDGRPILDEKDISKINEKLNFLRDKRDDLLTKDNNYFY